MRRPPFGPEIIESDRWEFLEHFGAGRRLSLREDDLPRSFIYCRRYHVITCEYAHHTLLMGALVWSESDHDYSRWREVREKRYTLDQLADQFIDEWEGAFYRSMTHDRMITCSQRLEDKGLGLNAFEKRQVSNLEVDWIHRKPTP